MTAFLFAPPVYQPLNGSGVPYPGALMRFMATGTTTPLDAWTTSAMDVAHEYPIEADAAGRFPPIYLSSLIAYKMVLTEGWTDPPTNSIYGSAIISPVDPINVISDVPGGTVVMFMGTAVQRAAAYPSALWTLCDGTNSSYDMRDRAPVGAGSTYTEGDALGATSGTTSSVANHDHGAATGSTAISASQMPSHTHFGIVDSAASSTALTGAPTLSVTRENGFTGGDTQYILRGAANTPTLGPTSSAGSGSGHTHSITAGGGHDHTVATVSPGRAVWFVMRRFS